ncbi:hypothetical protein N1F78_08370 [Seonamhaeicola sp. MEBiC1930]|uniref:hypothetical protein n=1 Tax=Seonamhaeicola sp. MEBiC01930 TaxID=2976768 RepID=UPI00324755F0
MIKHAYLFLFVLTATCQKKDVPFGTDLPNALNEVSGNEIIVNSNEIWMHNDGGNKPDIYCLNEKGELLRKITLDAKNEDWEDITSDSDGNLYIGDFGNNNNKRKNLKILRVPFNSLKKEGDIAVEKISFKYSDQKQFPPKKKKLLFDCEAFFYFNNSLYLFTKSRVENKSGKTNLYKLPAKKGKHKAKLIGSYNFGSSNYNWVTGADIRDDGKQIAILTQKDIWLFSNFKDDDFFNGSVKQIPFKHLSQKEGICYKNDNTLILTDENDHGRGGNMYEFKTD